MTAASHAMNSSERYVLGHSEDELDRLKTQARLIDPITRRFFEAAGVRPGMRVLDVGCGSGDTSLLLAEMVGPSGSVVGVDRAADAIVAARGRSVGRDNVRFVEGDPSDLRFDDPFDAAVGRFVLMFQAQPHEMLRRVALHVRPGGLIAFHELDYEGISTLPPLPTFDRLREWNAETTRRYGADPRMGAKLFATFVKAGLPAPTLHATALSARGGEAFDLLLLARNLTRSLLTAMERLGVASRSEVGIDTALERMHAEAVASDSVVVGHLQVGAWCAI